MSETPQHHEVRLSLGAYVLGHLDEREAAEVRLHVDTCTLCQAELAELVPVARALADARPEGTSAPDLPPLELGQRIEDEISTLRHREDRNRRLRNGAFAAAGAAAAVLAFLVGMRVGTNDAPEAAAIPLEHVEITRSAAGLSASADIVAHTWGVEVKLEATGLQAGKRFGVSVVSADGEEHPAGEFVGTGGQTMNCNLNSSVLRDAAVGFEVTNAAGKIVLESTFPT